MSKIIYLSQKKQKPGTQLVPTGQSTTPTAQTIKLWRLSIELDELVKQGVLEEGLPTDEIVTIMAHRLGTLISCCEKPEELSAFCTEIMKRILGTGKLTIGS